VRGDFRFSGKSIILSIRIFEGGTFSLEKNCARDSARAFTLYAIRFRELLSWPGFSERNRENSFRRLAFLSFRNAFSKRFLTRTFETRDATSEKRSLSHAPSAIRCHPGRTDIIFAPLFRSLSLLLFLVHVVVVVRLSFLADTKNF